MRILTTLVGNNKMLLYWELLLLIMNVKNNRDLAKAAQELRIANVNSQITIDQGLRLGRELLRRHEFLFKTKMVL